MVGPELVGERRCVAQDDEQHDAHVAVPILCDHEALEHVVERIDLAVDLGGSDAHASRG